MTSIKYYLLSLLEPSQTPILFYQMTSISLHYLASKRENTNFDNCQAPRPTYNNNNNLTQGAESIISGATTDDHYDINFSSDEKVNPQRCFIYFYETWEEVDDLQTSKGL